MSCIFLDILRKNYLTLKVQAWFHVHLCNERWKIWTNKCLKIKQKKIFHLKMQQPAAIPYYKYYPPFDQRIVNWYNKHYSPIYLDLANNDWMKLNFLCTRESFGTRNLYFCWNFILHTCSLELSCGLSLKQLKLSCGYFR